MSVIIFVAEAERNLLVYAGDSVTDSHGGDALPVAIKWSRGPPGASQGPAGALAASLGFASFGAASANIRCRGAAQTKLACCE